MQKDKAAHALIGVLTLVAGWIALVLYQHLGVGVAGAFMTTLMGVGLELYQRVRHEGTPDIKDAMATAVPGWLLMLVHALATH